MIVFFILLEKFDCGAQTKSEVGNDNVNKCKKIYSRKIYKGNKKRVSNS